ncbi:MAG: NADH-quinone oxidoreductase subunit NuoH [Aggregatilineales bacterium]
MADFLTSNGWNPTVALFVATLLGVIVVASFGLGWFAVIGLWLERKVSARIQDRMGPNRVGPFGLLQVVADLGKMITKEDIVPDGADRFVFNVAPLLAVGAVLLIWAVIPFSKQLIGADLNVGALYFASVASFGTLAVLLAGWSSNNKYALLGALRAVAALVSYEVPMVLSILTPVMLAGTMSMQGIVEQQHVWYIFALPISAFVFFVSTLAETGRSPFDVIEAESEIVSGYNIEYTGMKFGLFQAAEFVHAFTGCALMAVLFFGGWRGVGSDQANALGSILGFIYFFGKTMAIWTALTLVRYTVPRVRIDQMMAFNWKFLVPLSLVNVLVVALVQKLVVPDYPAAKALIDGGGIAGTLLSVFGIGLVAEVPRAVVLLIANAIVLAVMGTGLRQAISGERPRAGSQPAPLANTPSGTGHPEAIAASAPAGH